MTLATVSNHIAVYLDKNLATNQDNSEIYAYGLEILLGAVIKLSIVFLLGWIFNVFGLTLIVLVTYAAFRCFGGGAHMSTYLKCLLLGTTVVVGMGLLSQFNLATHLLAYIATFALVFALFVCYKWVPGDTEKKPISDREVRNRQKRKMAIIIAVWGLIILYLLHHSLNTYALAMILGSISSVFLIAPWGYSLLTTIDKWT